MLALPYRKQETEYDCGSACLQMVFEFWGKEISQKELAQRLGTGPDVWASNERMEEIAREEGFHTLIKKNSTLEDIRNFLALNIPVIVNFLDMEDKGGHFAVITDLTDEAIILSDPWHGEKYSLPLNYFLPHWHSFEGGRDQWLLAISTNLIVNS